MTKLPVITVRHYPATNEYSAMWEEAEGRPVELRARSMAELNREFLERLAAEPQSPTWTAPVWECILFLAGIATEYKLRRGVVSQDELRAARQALLADLRLLQHRRYAEKPDLPTDEERLVQSAKDKHEVLDGLLKKIPPIPAAEQEATLPDLETVADSHAPIPFCFLIMPLESATAATNGSPNTDAQKQAAPVFGIATRAGLLKAVLRVFPPAMAEGIIQSEAMTLDQAALLLLDRRCGKLHRTKVAVKVPKRRPV